MRLFVVRSSAKTMARNLCQIEASDAPAEGGGAVWPRPVIFDGIRASTLDGMAEALAGVAAPRTWVAADLSLGAWQSDQVAREFCAQLGTPLPHREQRSLGALLTADGPNAQADLVGEFVDLETRGNQVVLRARALAAKIAAAVVRGPPRTFLVITPRYGWPWETENILFTRFFARALETTAGRLVLVDPELGDPVVPEGWIVRWRDVEEHAGSSECDGLVALVPGVVTPEAAAAVEAVQGSKGVRMLTLARGCKLVAPECRRLPANVSELEYAQLAVGVRRFDWLTAYAQFHGYPLLVDPWFLYRQARRRLAEGSDGLALRLAGRAVACARDSRQRAIFQSLVQGARIASKRFGEAADEHDPAPDVPADLRWFLLEAKGWGLVMTSDPGRAEPYLSEARILLGRSGLDEHAYLYLLNISALGRVKLNDLKGAMAMEREIEVRHARLACRDWRLEYLNSLNIARLQRRLGDLEAAERYYVRAFATTLGARSEGDSIYANFSLARLERERGRLVPAFDHYARAALHWVSATVPEALGARVASAIVGRRLGGADDLVEEVSRVLLSLLRDSAEAAHLKRVVAAMENVDGSTAPVFVRGQRMHDHDARGMGCAVLVPGWSILAAPAVLLREEPETASPSHRRLRSSLAALLELACTADELRNVQTIVVDDRLGQEVATTGPELLETCLRLRVPRIAWGSDAAELNASVSARLETRLRIRPGSAVDRLEFDPLSPCAVFKRYLAPRALTADEHELLSLLDDQPSIEQLRKRTNHSHAAVMSVVRSLERNRVISPYLEDGACAAAGVEIPSDLNPAWMEPLER